MSQINNPVEYSIQGFVENVYPSANKNILFWDTCALLEILRFPYRENHVRTYEILNKLNGLIQNDDIYSLASSLTIKEWNDNEGKVKKEMQDSLEKTDYFHSTCLNIVNEILSTEYISESIHNKDLVQNLERLVDDILSKTLFISTNEIANDALVRVRDKRPPASKKQEFKDCTVWETIIKLSRDINLVEQESLQVFYTVNTDDFVDKSIQNKPFNRVLLSEASLSNLRCCSKLIEADSCFSPPEA